MNSLKLHVPHLEFSAGSIDVQTFQRQYFEKGWLGRKIIALPAAVWTGLIKSIYHFICYSFARSLSITHSFLSCRRFNMPFKVKSCSEVHRFYGVRNVQESYGWLICLFNDRCGQFRVQNSRSHKKFYDAYLAQVSLILICNKSLKRHAKLIEETLVEEEALMVIAENCRQNGYLLQAENIYCKLAFHLPERDVLLKKISETYLRQGRLRANDKILQQLGYDANDRDYLYRKTVKKQLALKNWKKAEIIIYHLNAPWLREKCLVSFLKARSLEGDLKDFFTDMMAEYCWNILVETDKNYTKILDNRLDGVSITMDFFNALGNNFYEEIKEHFEHKEFKTIIQKMILKVKERSTEEKLRELLENLNG